MHSSRTPYYGKYICLLTNRGGYSWSTRWHIHDISLCNEKMKLWWNIHPQIIS